MAWNHTLAWIVVLGASTVAGVVRATPPTSATSEDLARERIRAHLSQVERTLRAVDAGGLPPGLARERARNLDRLHEYWVRGVFPRNHRFPEGRVPFFIDGEERACAVGHLMIESGRGEL